METRHYYHYATKGLEEDVLFSSVRSFIAGMNRIALCFLLAGGSVLIFAFCLMDNHVHFILYGTEDDCDKFMSDYKRLTEIWLANHPEEGSPGKKWDIGHWLISNREALKEKIAYVHRNPMVAHLPYTPCGYRWSSGSLMFSDCPDLKLCARSVASLSVREQRKLFESRIQLPSDWFVLPDNMIWTGCYTEYKRSERLFSSVFDYQFELNRKCEDSVNREMMENSVSLPDGEVMAMAVRICNNEFNGKKIAELSLDERIRLSKKLKKESGSTTKQIARLVRIKVDDLRQLI